MQGHKEVRGTRERIGGTARCAAACFAPALHCIVAHLGEGGRRGPFKAYERNKMKTPIRILVGGPEVTSAFVLMELALTRPAMAFHPA